VNTFSNFALRIKCARQFVKPDC